METPYLNVRYTVHLALAERRPRPWAAVGGTVGKSGEQDEW